MPVTVALAKAVLISPALVGEILSIDVQALQLVVETDNQSLAVDVTVGEIGTVTTLTTYTVVGTKRRFSGSIPLPLNKGVYNLSIRAKDALDASYTKISPNLSLQVIRTSNLDVPQALPPAGIRVYRLSNFVRVEWQRPTDGGFLGVRVKVSPDATGLTTPFTQTGYLVDGISRVGLDTLSSLKTVVQNGDHTITTVDEQKTQVAYSAMEFARSQVDYDEFYVQLSTVLQDPDTHHVHESYAAGPFKCSFVDLRKVQPTDFPAGFTPEDEAAKLIQNLTQEYPQLDLAPRSEMRDVLVDPVALELSNDSTRQWFTRVSQSVSALAQIDDADGDGESDDPATSDYKQSLAKAFRLSDQQVQVMIDKQFDVLGERAGVTREGAQEAIGVVLLYTLSKPTQRITIEAGAMVNTLPDAETPSVSYRTLGSAVIDPTAADSYYMPDRGWWGVELPCMCTVAGTVGNVGAGTIRTVISGLSSPMLCTNLKATDFGLDIESNANYASRIADRLVVGVDTGRRLGYQAEAQKAYGVVGVKVVASGDLEMLRDWDDLRQKHIFGTVDIYARGRSFSQNTQQLPYRHQLLGTPGVGGTYAKMRILDVAKLRLGYDGVNPDYHAAALVEVYVERQGAGSTLQSLSFYFGVENAQFDPNTHSFYLDPNALTYRVVNGVITPGGTNASLLATAQNGATITALVRLWSPLSTTPTQQPVMQVYSVVGADNQTGVIPVSDVRLIKSEDPLLNGGSSKAHDKVVVDNNWAPEVLTMTFDTNGPSVLPLGEGVVVDVAPTGLPLDILAVRSSDGMTLYTFGANRDYDLVPQGQYGSYGIRRTANSTIPLDAEILVSFNRYRFVEHLTLHQETLALSGATFQALGSAGFVDNVWAPVSHGMNTLVNDAALASAQIPRDRRYIKVFGRSASKGIDVAMVEGKDFILDLDAVTGAVKIARYASGGTISSDIPDGGSVVVSYYAAEVFTITTRYPEFVGQIAQRIEDSRHAAADVLVKVMQENLVDLDLTVDISTDTTPEVVDRKIRTIIVAAFDNAKTILTQAELVRRIKAIPGVENVRVPFRRMAKADGSYDVGLIIPTGTKWDPISSLTTIDPTFGSRAWAPRTFITHSPVLRYKTIPGGGLTDAYVGLLYEGESYRRARSFREIQNASSAAFYIIGINDRFDEFTPVDTSYYGKIIMVTPAPTAGTSNILSDPAAVAFRVTYQVFGEAGAQDIPLSPTEYLKPGKITIDYVLGGTTR